MNIMYGCCDDILNSLHITNTYANDYKCMVRIYLDGSSILAFFENQLKIK